MIAKAALHTPADPATLPLLGLPVRIPYICGSLVARLARRLLAHREDSAHTAHL